MADDLHPPKSWPPKRWLPAPSAYVFRVRVRVLEEGTSRTYWKDYAKVMNSELPKAIREAAAHYGGHSNVEVVPVVEVFRKIQKRYDTMKAYYAAKKANARPEGLPTVDGSQPQQEQGKPTDR